MRSLLIFFTTTFTFATPAFAADPCEGPIVDINVCGPAGPRVLVNLVCKPDPADPVNARRCFLKAEDGAPTGKAVLFMKANDEDPTLQINISPDMIEPESAEEI